MWDNYPFFFRTSWRSWHEKNKQKSPENQKRYKTSHIKKFTWKKKKKEKEKGAHDVNDIKLYIYIYIYIS